MPWHPGAGAGCSEQRPGGTVALGYIHTYILGGRYRDAVSQLLLRRPSTAAAPLQPMPLLCIRQKMRFPE